MDFSNQLFCSIVILLQKKKKSKPHPELVCLLLRKGLICPRLSSNSPCMQPRMALNSDLCCDGRHVSPCPVLWSTRDIIQASICQLSHILPHPVFSNVGNKRNENLESLPLSFSCLVLLLLFCSLGFCFVLFFEAGGDNFGHHLSMESLAPQLDFIPLLEFQEEFPKLTHIC